MLDVREALVKHTWLTFVDDHDLDILPSLKCRFAGLYALYLGVYVVVPWRHCAPGMNRHPCRLNDVENDERGRL
jgi:hypothetical protein